MSRITIVPSDGVVMIDNVATYDVDLAALVGNGVHAVQWNGESGEVEWTADEDLNTTIDSLDDYQTYIDAAEDAIALAKTRAADPYYGMSDAQKLEAKRPLKATEIDQAFITAESQPITVGEHSYKGGFQSGMALDAQRRMMVEYAAVNPDAGITTVDFFDTSGNKVILPLVSDTEIDALDVCLAVGNKASENSFTCSSLQAQVEAAETLEELEAICWPEA